MVKVILYSLIVLFICGNLGETRIHCAPQRYIDLQQQPTALNIGENKFDFTVQFEFWNADAQEYQPFRGNYYSTNEKVH